MIKSNMYNRVVYRFIVSQVDEQEIQPSKIFERFIQLYDGIYFAGIPIKINFKYSSMNKKSIYIHGSCKYPYEVSFDDEDYNLENAVLSGIDITDMINDKCLDMSQGKKMSNVGIVSVLDVVMVNDINCSDMIDGLM